LAARATDRDEAGADDRLEPARSIMIHPLLRLAATEPHLIGDHVEAYAALVGEEVHKVSTSWATRIGLYVGALFLGALGLVLVGVALLLCASLPSSAYPAPWAMIVVPLVPLAGAVVCLLIARSKRIENGFDTLKKQINADMAMLREVSAP
jgi:cytochrome bd-type quinol oxidase subunit 2